MKKSLQCTIMARRKSNFKFRIPLLKFNFKINRRTFFTIIGLLILSFGLICLLSFVQSGAMLTQINNRIVGGFGVVSLIFPVIIILISSHFFNSTKLKLIKFHVTVGLCFIFIALLGILKSGKYGQFIFDNLILDFSSVGAYIILLVTLIVGVIIFLNTSLDDFLIIASTIFNKIGTYLYEGILLPISEKLKSPKSNNQEIKINESGFSDQKTIAATHATVVPVQSQAHQSSRSTDSPNPTDFKLSSLPTLNFDNWQYPPLSLLEQLHGGEADYGDPSKNSSVIEKTLDSFGIRAKIVEVNKGPTVAQYGLQITTGTKLSKITGLSTDLALALAAPGGQVRIEAPIPGRSLVGIEIPNRKSQIVALAKLLSDPEMINNPKPTIVPLGFDVSGKAQFIDIAAMPHMLVAGATGSGKSMILTAWILSMLFRTTPRQLRLILVDPKRVEFTQYNGIPHLLSEVIVDAKEILSSLKWTVGEMESRYKLFAQAGAKNIESYNTIPGVEQIPYIVFIIDELAELMTTSPQETEGAITRIAQLARATGIHLILATQRPSVNVITGLMKANIPARLAFNVPSLVDSRVILDTPGAEKLLGKGDMLFQAPDQGKPKRIQGPYTTEKDVLSLVEFIRAQVPRVDYTETITKQSGGTSSGGSGMMGTDDDGDTDSIFREAVSAIYESQQASASFLQRKFKIGYARAARILDQLEQAGYVGKPQGQKQREILNRPQQSEEIT